MQKFRQAQSKMDRGELEAAVLAFDEFLRENEQSALCPNALFGKIIQELSYQHGCSFLIWLAKLANRSLS